MKPFLCGIFLLAITSSTSGQVESVSLSNPDLKLLAEGLAPTMELVKYQSEHIQLLEQRIELLEKVVVDAAQSQNKSNQILASLIEKYETQSVQDKSQLINISQELAKILATKK